MTQPLTIDVTVVFLKNLYETTRAAVAAHPPAPTRFESEVSFNAWMEERLALRMARARNRAQELVCWIPDMVEQAANAGRFQVHVLDSFRPMFTYSNGICEAIQLEQWEEDNEVASYICEACENMQGVTVPNSAKPYRLFADRINYSVQDSKLGRAGFTLNIAWTAY